MCVFVITYNQILNTDEEELMIIFLYNQIDCEFYYNFVIHNDGTNSTINYYLEVHLDPG